MTEAVGRRRVRVLAAAALLLVLALLAALAVRPASAARLTLTGAQITTASARPCAATALAAATPTTSGASSTQVVLSEVPAACRGLVATVRLFAADGTALAGGDTSATLASAATTTVTVPVYPPSRVAGVAVTVGTWGLPATWTAVTGSVSGPVTPGPATTFGTLTWTQVASSGTQACVSVPVSATAGSTWRIDLNLAQRPFNGVTSGAGFIVSPWWAGVTSTTPVNGVVSVAPRPGMESLAGGQTTVTICHYGLPAPQHDAALTYTQTPGTPTGTADFACMVVGIAVTGSPQFYAGWRTDVDVAPLVAFFAARGRTADLRTLAVGGNYSVAAQGGTVYRVTPTAWDTWGVRDDAPRSFQVCLRP